MTRIHVISVDLNHHGTLHCGGRKLHLLKYPFLPPTRRVAFTWSGFLRSKCCAEHVRTFFSSLSETYNVATLDDVVRLVCKSKLLTCSPNSVLTPLTNHVIFGGGLDGDGTVQLRLRGVPMTARMVLAISSLPCVSSICISVGGPRFKKKKKKKDIKIGMRQWGLRIRCFAQGHQCRCQKIRTSDFPVESPWSYPLSHNISSKSSVWNTSGRFRGDVPYDITTILQIFFSLVTLHQKERS